MERCSRCRSPMQPLTLHAPLPLPPRSMPDGVGEFVVYPLYGALPPQEQLKAFGRAPPGTRKVRVWSHTKASAGQIVPMQARGLYTRALACIHRCGWYWVP